MSDERLEPGSDDIDDLELGDEDADELEPDEEEIDEPEEPIDPRRQRAEQRRQEAEARQRARQDYENRIAQSIPQSTQAIREQVERLRYLDDDALNQHAQQLAQAQANQRIFAIRDEAAKEAYAKEARRAGKTRSHIAKIEQGLATVRATGNYTATRKDVEIYLAGMEAMGMPTGNAPAPRSRSNSGGTGRSSARESEQERADRKLLKSVTWGDVERGYRR